MRILLSLVVVVVGVAACDQEAPQSCDQDTPCPQGQACVKLPGTTASQEDVYYCQDEFQSADSSADSTGDASVVIDAVPPPPPTPDTGVGPEVDAALPDASPPSMDPCPAGSRVVSVTPSLQFPGQLEVTLNYGAMTGTVCYLGTCEDGTLTIVGMSTYQLTTASYYFRTLYMMGSNLPSSFVLLTSQGGSLVDVTGLFVSTIGGTGTGSYVDHNGGSLNDTLTVTHPSRDILLIQRDGDHTTLTVGTVCR